jgi:hypothetical protein
MPYGKTCGRCLYFIKVRWNDNPREHSHCFGRNGICEITDFNVMSDSGYAKRCKYYKHRKYDRLKKVLGKDWGDEFKSSN